MFVGALWGCTNPLLKQGSGSAAYQRTSDSFGQYVYEFYCTLTNWKFIIPFALNQSGSIAFVYFLGSSGNLPFYLDSCRALADIIHF
ncbi:hypothetical protein AaE_005175 [Aphanomyces astaci]|uniref:Uncharacterized protein n=1 Tax=Aphanomyces astaci TaxID=112090 RepID=A0A6A5ALT1_APHAT|nr:hypothetical protein AaE_005175 [Aphanomyces astaci]